jgi:hypothetical protein
MAKIDKNGNIRGAVGPVTYRKLKTGQKVVQTKTKPKQTKNTKLAAADFATSARIARHIRLALQPIVAGFESNYMPSRLGGTMFSALNQSISQSIGTRTVADHGLGKLAHFQFNPDSPFGDYCLLEPAISYTAEDGLKITLPECIDIESFVLAPGATDCELCFFVVVQDLDGMSRNFGNPLKHEEVFRVPMPMRGNVIPAAEFSLPPQPEGHLITVAAAVFYYKTDSLIGSIGMNNDRLHPCEILRAVLT